MGVGAPCQMGGIRPATASVRPRAPSPRLASMAAIEVRGLEREFGGGVKAVRGVDLDVAAGEIYAFLGPNGAGKTTTVRMLTTLLRPTGGTARVAGHDVVSEAGEVRKSIGVALQEAALDPLMTGRELIRLQATLHGLSRDEGRSRAEALLTRVGLDHAADRRVGTYSGGMRRRLDLASALVHRPRDLFLDEPTTGLDPVSRKAIWEEVEALNGDGATIFLTTQYLEEADQLADRVGIIAGGLLVAEDTPTALKAEIGNAHLEIALGDERVALRLADPRHPAPALWRGAVRTRLAGVDLGDLGVGEWRPLAPRELEGLRRSVRLPPKG